MMAVSLNTMDIQSKETKAFVNHAIKTDASRRSSAASVAIPVLSLLSQGKNVPPIPSSPPPIVPPDSVAGTLLRTMLSDMVGIG
jgi:hypothetical protein